MTKQLKKIGKRLITFFNLTTARNLNDKRIFVPVINGIKVGVSGEKWMSGILKEIFQFDSGCFYDIGVNLGQTLIKVRTLDTNRKYVGFEPNPSCLFYLQRLISANQWNQVMIVPVGLSNTNGLVELSGSSDTDPGSTIIRWVMSTAGGVTKLVPVFQYENLTSCLPIDRVAIIKIDVEGAELEVVKTLSPLIERDRPIIIMEILPTGSERNQRNIRTKELMSILKDMKYNSFRIMKTSSDSYAGVTQVNDIGEYSDPLLKDHIFVPVELVEAIMRTLTIASTQTEPTL